MSTLSIILTLILLLSVIYSVLITIKLFRVRVELAQAEGALKNEGLLLERFRSLSSQTLEGQSQQFLQLAKSTLEKENISAKTELEKQKLAIDHLVDPLKKKLDEYQLQIRNIENDRTRAFTQIDEELKRVAQLNTTLVKETSALKNALKKPHIRGRWGEVQLKNCIELAGMSEYVDVTFQDVTSQDDGSRLIPDLTVKMPGGRIVIVDAKTPLDAFLSSLEATDDEARGAELARHGRHVKEHIKKLSTKAYAENISHAADFTVMFLPNESFLYAALEVEPDVMEFALNKKILIATPPTFVGLLKVIHYGWSEQRLADNAQKISEIGKELHKRIVDFTESYVGVGKALEKAKAEYDSGLVRLQSRVVTQAKRLESLGAKSSKALPAEIDNVSDLT